MSHIACWQAVLRQWQSAGSHQTGQLAGCLVALCRADTVLEHTRLGGHFEAVCWLYVKGILQLLCHPLQQSKARHSTARFSGQLRSSRAGQSARMRTSACTSAPSLLPAWDSASSPESSHACLCARQRHVRCRAVPDDLAVQSSTAAACLRLC